MLNSERKPPFWCAHSRTGVRLQGQQLHESAVQILKTKAKVKRMSLNVTFYAVSLNNKSIDSPSLVLTQLMAWAALQMETMADVDLELVGLGSKAAPSTH